MRCGWCSSERLFHLSSKLFYLLTPEFRSSLHFYCLLLCNLSAAMFCLYAPNVFSPPLESSLSHLTLSFRHHANKKAVSDSRLRVSSEGLRVQEKKERWIIRCCVWWAGDLWFLFRKSSSEKRDAFDADFRISLNSVSRKWRLKQKRQTGSQQTVEPQTRETFPLLCSSRKMEKKNSKNKEQLPLSSIFFTLAKKTPVSKQELYCRQWGQRQQ